MMSQARSRTLASFMHVSLDGYFCDAHGSMAFAHKPPDDVEWQEFVSKNASGGSMLLFGRITFDMMAAWWPTPMAAEAMPEVAARMNEMPKVVFSRTLESVAWRNTTLVKGDLVETVGRMKSEPGPDMTILGSGSIVTQLAEARLIDTFQIVVNPVALGGGSSLLSGLGSSLDLVLRETRSFRNGAVVLWYAPC